LRVVQRASERERERRRADRGRSNKRWQQPPLRFGGPASPVARGRRSCSSPIRLAPDRARLDAPSASLGAVRDAAGVKESIARVWRRRPPPLFFLTLLLRPAPSFPSIPTHTGGRHVVQYKKKQVQHPRCAVSGVVLQGVSCGGGSFVPSAAPPSAERRAAAAAGWPCERPRLLLRLLLTPYCHAHPRNTDQQHPTPTTTTTTDTQTPTTPTKYHSSPPAAPPSSATAACRAATSRCRACTAASCRTRWSRSASCAPS
jgi:hypothetical protein